MNGKPVDVYCMGLHWVLTVVLDDRNEYRILRVPGGWIYERWFNETDRGEEHMRDWLWQLLGTTFIPYDPAAADHQNFALDWKKEQDEKAKIPPSLGDRDP